MDNKKGQAAMEFLTTYGWAFLIIIVAIAGLTYFGVFDFRNKLPDACNTGMKLQCQGYGINTTGVQLNLKNTELENIYVKKIVIKEKTSTTTCTAPSTTPTTITASGAGRDVTFTPFTGACGIVTKKKSIFDVQVFYTIGTSAIETVASGQITTTVK
jgi:uncharacterized protein (UPF0333 family)